MATVAERKEDARLRKENARLRDALWLTRNTMNLLLKTAQAFEAQASHGSGDRRGGPVFTKARAAIATATKALGEPS